MAKDRWDKADIIAKIVATLFVPIVLATIGIYFNNVMKEKEQFQKDKEISQKYFEISIGILNSKPTSDNQPLRDWAINTINKNADIKLSPAAVKLLKEKPLPRYRSVYQENPVSLIEGDTFLKDEKGNLLTDEKGIPLKSK